MICPRDKEEGQQDNTWSSVEKHKKRGSDTCIWSELIHEMNTKVQISEYAYNEIKPTPTTMYIVNSSPPPLNETIAMCH